MYPEPLAWREGWYVIQGSAHPLVEHALRQCTRFKRLLDAPCQYSIKGATGGAKELVKGTLGLYNLTGDVFDSCTVLEQVQALQPHCSGKVGLTSPLLRHRSNNLSAHQPPYRQYWHCTCVAVQWQRSTKATHRERCSLQLMNLKLCYPLIQGMHTLGELMPDCNAVAS